MTTITPSRGDRPRLLENCIAQMKAQTVRPNEMRIVDYKPKGNRVDLTERVRIGLTHLEDDSATIIEDDDYYPINYIEVVTEALKTHDVVGFDFSYYYHIKTKRYHRFNHPGRASLFCTSFRTKVLEGFNWPADDHLFLDINLWQYFNNRGFSIKFIDESECMPIGIKHGIGKTGGMGHNKSHLFIDQDTNEEWLKKHTNKESFKFYTTL